MRSKSQFKGIFCLEGPWEKDLRMPTSVRPILDMLHANSKIDHVYRTCATKGEFEFHLKKCALRTYDAFPILYFATHGQAAGLCFEDGTCDLDELAGHLENRCHNKIVICGSCSTLAGDKRHLKRFLARTGALAICGYKSDIYWLQSAAFEILLIAEMQKNEFSGRGIEAIRKRVVEVAKATVFQELKFRIVTSKE